MHYNCVHDTLLLDGQVVCTLPLTYRRNSLYRKTFEDRKPDAYHPVTDAHHRVTDANHRVTS